MNTRLAVKALQLVLMLFGVAAFVGGLLALPWYLILAGSCFLALGWFVTYKLLLGLTSPFFVRNSNPYSQG